MESSVVTLEMKESYQRVETSTIELTKIRSNKNEGSSLSINEEFTSNVKHVHQYIHPQPRSSSWSSSFFHSRLISLSILQPLSPEKVDIIIETRIISKSNKQLSKHRIQLRTMISPRILQTTCDITILERKLT